MRRREVAQRLGMLGLLTVPVMLTVGCRNHMPHALTWPGGGTIEQVHAKPPEGGYYSNWDPYSVELEVTPLDDVNPVRTQHFIIATVKDKEGKALPNRRIEWIINEGSVGDIVEVDESGWRAARGYKVGNDYAVSHTNNFSHVLDMGDDDPSNDISLSPGQTWCCITSPIEGETYVTVYAPGIYDKSKHKVFAVKKWYDVKWEFPPPATNPIGTTHTFTTSVAKYSDGSPLEGYIVTYKLLDGPAGSFEPGNGTIASVPTDGSGKASVTLRQANPAEGTNNVEVSIMRPENVQCCKPPVQIATGQTSKTWIGPKISCDKTGPGSVLVGEQFNFTINVTNPSRVDATNVMVTDNLPEGLTLVSSSPPAQGSTYALGTVPAGGTKTVTLSVKADRSGRFENCAEVTGDHNLSSRCCASVTAQSPKLTIEKRCPAEVTVCDTIEYVITVRNAGDGPATNVRVEDRVPAGLQVVSGSPSATLGTLNAGESKEIRMTVKADKAGTYDNVAIATGDAGLTAEAHCTTTVKQPVLAVQKTGPAERYIGRSAAYEITVSNTGDFPANNTVLRDPIPAGMQFESASDGGANSGGTVTWNLGTIPPGGSKKVTLNLKATAAGSVKNVATATATCAEASAETEMGVKGVPAILLEVVDVEDPIEVGANITYVITVTNQGSAVGTNIKIVCELPGELDYVSSDGATPGSASGKSVSFGPLPSLAPQAKAQWRIVCKGNAAGDVRFKVSMTSDQMSSPAVEETESTHVY